MTMIRGSQGGYGAEAGRAARLQALQGDVREARALLGGPASARRSSHLEEQDIERALQSLNVASEELVALLALCGIETPLGWRLHNLRSRLDAHLLAADALRDADAPAAAVSVLHRTVDFVGIEVETLLAEA